MKKLSLALVAMVFSVAASAQGKVVIVNLQAAIIQTEAAKKSLQALDADADFAAMKAKFESLRADLVNLDKDAKTNGMTWSVEQKADHRKKVEYKSADLKLAAEKLKAERNAVVKRIMQEQGRKAQEVLNELVTSEDIGLVLDASVAHFANASYDITGKVTDKLNKAK
ncbi:OmpH family outer membrane protein [Pseudomaricurvus alkylphenolicus]|jgi:outer membrane protein|uniref:OmpH family outer membrane protein n=1 Tax=Pseudomaricurvus alkylphenolicus TaxID=1306991 RepID=UPI001420B325|nr:OmpH family outer membrane protein [Pseudomaricurvus alkylphenolicus]NIB39845.1 OmpH family outer membrane protein [Pseudomaricurvus alkylphenolicus]